jgi:hypothetical protein
LLYSRRAGLAGLPATPARRDLRHWQPGRIIVLLQRRGHSAAGMGVLIVKSFQAFAAAAGILLAPMLAAPAAAQAPADTSKSFTEKLNAYVGCINRLSERSYESRNRYFSWAAKTGPTGKERIIYGTYTIYDTSDCKKNVEKANLLEPRDPELEAAATAYVAAVTTLEPLLKTADDYYQQENYKDDKMAKGKAIHPQLVAAWDAFGTADKALRAGVDTVNDKRALQRLAELEKAQGKKARYYVEATMISAKRVLRAENTDKPDIAAITQAIGDYEELVKAAEQFAGGGTDGKIGSMFISSAKSFLTSAKQLMRRIRDKTPYSQGDRMMLSAGSGWMVEGSPPRVLRDYNQLIEAYNRGGNI